MILKNDYPTISPFNFFGGTHECKSTPILCANEYSIKLATYLGDE